VARKLQLEQQENVFCIATADPYKFGDTVTQATGGVVPPMPAHSPLKGQPLEVDYRHVQVLEPGTTWKDVETALNEILLKIK
jgi:threonine synthase